MIAWLPGQVKILTNDGITGWQAAAAFPTTQSGVLPHQMKMPEVILKPEKREGILYEFGRELIGYVSFHCDGPPSIIVGESVTEASDTVVSHHEQTLTLMATAGGRPDPGPSSTGYRAGTRTWPSR